MTLVLNAEQSPRQRDDTIANSSPWDSWYPWYQFFGHHALSWLLWIPKLVFPYILFHFLMLQYHFDLWHLKTPPTIMACPIKDTTFDLGSIGKKMISVNQLYELIIHFIFTWRMKIILQRKTKQIMTLTVLKGKPFVTVWLNAFPLFWWIVILQTDIGLQVLSIFRFSR